MPVIHHAAGSGIPESFLFLLEPDWSDGGPTLTYRRPSTQVEGLTGIEDRAPGVRASRVRQDVNLQLNATAAAAVRGMLATLAGARIAIPLWVDAYRPEAEWMHAPQKVIAWNDAGAYEILAPGAPSALTYRAPLLIGRLVERPTIKTGSPAIDTGAPHLVSIAVEEDSPWECRIEPAAGVVATEFVWQPDWSSDPQDVSRDQLRLTELGQGREAGVAGTDGRPRWGQSAAFTLDRTEAADLLRFWSDRGGAVRSFTAPAWCRPGEDTPQTPHEYTARFDKDFLELEFETPDIIRCELKLWQEVTLDVGEPAQSGDAKAHLYVFLPEGSTTKRFTSWEHDLVYGGFTYTKAPPGGISHSGLRQTLSPVSDECSVEAFSEWAENPLRPFAAGDAERRIRCAVSEVRIDAAGAVVRVEELITGEIRSLEHKTDKIVGKIKGFGGAFSRQLPGHYIQRGCNYVLGDVNCALAKAALARPGTLSGALPAVTVNFTPDVAPSGSYAAKWFAEGWLEVTGTDGELYRRPILDCTEAGGVWTLTLNRFLPAVCAGQPATAYPGCNGNYSTCDGKFGNADNFGGDPFAPAYISTSEGNGSAAGMK